VGIVSTLSKSGKRRTLDPSALYFVDGAAHISLTRRQSSSLFCSSFPCVIGTSLYFFAKLMEDLLAASLVHRSRSLIGSQLRDISFFPLSNVAPARTAFAKTVAEHVLKLKCNGHNREKLDNQSLFSSPHMGHTTLTSPRTTPTGHYINSFQHLLYKVSYSVK